MVYINGENILKCQLSIYHITKCQLSIYHITKCQLSKIISQNDPTLELVLDNNFVVHLLNDQTALSSTLTLTLYSYGL